MKKRLKLNRETVINLTSAAELERIQGGIISSDNDRCLRDMEMTKSCYLYE